MLSVLDASSQSKRTQQQGDNAGSVRDVDAVVRLKPSAAAASLSHLLLAAAPEQASADHETSFDGDGVEPPNWQYAIKTLTKCMFNQRRLLDHPVTAAIPWAAKYPHLIDYYAHNAPDYTGMGLYSAFAYPNDHRRLIVHNAEHWAAQVMISEFAKAPKATVHSLELRGRVLDITNKRLGDPARATDPGTLQFILSIVAATVVSGIGLDSVKSHLRGLKTLADIIADQGRPLAPWMHQLFQELDGITTVLTGRPLVFGPVEPNRRILVSADHPFRVAMYPLTSDLSPKRWNAYMLTINGSGAQSVFRVMYNLRTAVVQCFDPPHRVSPQDFLQRLAEMESVILMIGSTPSSYTLSHPAFSSYDAAKQAFVVETLRLMSLLLIHVASHTVCPNAASYSKIDATVQMAIQHLAAEEAVEVPVVTLWAWFVVGPFTPPASHHEATCESRVLEMSARIALGLTYDNVRDFMLDLYYIPQIQDGCLLDIWQRISPNWENQPRMGLPADQVMPSGRHAQMLGVSSLATAPDVDEIKAEADPAGFAFASTQSKKRKQSHHGS